jgi:hypothetical protein
LGLVFLDYFWLLWAFVSTRLKGSQFHRFGGSQASPFLVPTHTRA